MSDKDEKENNIENKVVLIIGGAGDIGCAIADNFLKKKARVVIILDINEKTGKEVTRKLEETYGKHKAVFNKYDATRDLEWLPKKFIHIYNHFDIVVNNAGVVDEADRVKAIETNLLRLIQSTLKIWRFYRKDMGSRGCTIINIASTHGVKVNPFLPTYQAAHFGVIGFTKSIGHSYHYKRTGVRVMALCPGFTRTEMMSNPKTMPYYKIKDEKFEKDFEEYLKNQIWQEADVVGEAAVKMFEEGDSGNIWAIEGGNVTKNFQ